MLAERRLRPDRSLQDDAWLGQGRGDHIRIVALLRRALMEDIAVRAPRLQRSLHRGGRDRLVEEAKRW